MLIRFFCGEDIKKNLKEKKNEKVIKDLHSICTTLFFGLTTVALAANSEMLSNIDWNSRHHVEFYGELANELAAEYPDIAKTYSIGRS